MIQAYLSGVSAAYVKLTHAPYDTNVHAAYSALKTELMNQYELLTSFIDVSFTAVDPYASVDEMFADLSGRRRLKVYTVADMPASHPLADKAYSHGQYLGVNMNAIFRAVHDGIAHYPQRNTFTYTGEFQAFQAHGRLLSGMALWALATETLAQNAWLHFGPMKHLPIGNRPFAPQKAGLLPWDMVMKGLAL